MGLNPLGISSNDQTKPSTCVLFQCVNQNHPFPLLDGVFLWFWRLLFQMRHVRMQTTLRIGGKPKPRVLVGDLVFLICFRVHTTRFLHLFAGSRHRPRPSKQTSWQELLLNSSVETFVDDQVIFHENAAWSQEEILWTFTRRFPQKVVPGTTDVI